MEPLAARIALAERHVRDGLGVIARQHSIIARLRGYGISTATAEALLAAFERSQAMFEDDLGRLIAERANVSLAVGGIDARRSALVDASGLRLCDAL